MCPVDVQMPCHARTSDYLSLVLQDFVTEERKILQAWTNTPTNRYERGLSKRLPGLMT